MGRVRESKWLYAYLPQGISGGATSTLILLFAYALGGNLVNVGIIAAATSIASVPAFMLWGGLSDRFELRKPFLLIGFVGSGVALVAMAASRTMSEFYIANLLAGCLGAASGPAGTVLLMETSDRKDWPGRLAIVSRITAAGWTVGLAFAASWLAINGGFMGGPLSSMRALFLVGAGMSFFAGLIVLIAAPMTSRHLDRTSVTVADSNLRVERGRYLPLRVMNFVGPQDVGHLRMPKSFRVFLACVFLWFAGFTAFYSFFPIFLTQVYGLGSSQIFAIYIASQVASIAVYPRVADWVSARGSGTMQVYGSLGRSVLFGSFFILGLTGIHDLARLGLVVGLHAGVGACWAVINVAGSTLASRLAPQARRARALGAFNAVQGFGSILGPLAGGFAAGFLGYGWAFATSVGLVVAGSAVLWAARIRDA
jgi:MFS family permease